MCLQVHQRRRTSGLHFAQQLGSDVLGRKEIAGCEKSMIAETSRSAVGARFTR